MTITPTSHPLARMSDKKAVAASPDGNAQFAAQAPSDLPNSRKSVAKSLHMNRARAVKMRFETMIDEKTRPKPESQPQKQQAAKA